MTWEIQWGSPMYPVDMHKRIATDPHGEMVIYMAECPSVPRGTWRSPIPPRGFGRNEDEAILDLYRDIHRRMT